MDVKRVTIFCLFRIFLPFALLSAVAFRFNFMSFLYLLCLLVNPLLSGPSSRYLKTVIGLSISFCLCHVIFQSVMLSLGNYGNLIDYCHWKGRLYALFGFHRYDSISIQDALRLAGLDFWVMFAAVGVFVVIEKLQALPPPVPPTENGDLADGDVVRRPVRRRKKRRSEVLYWTGETFVLFFLAGSGILYPSLSSAVYFLVFLTVCTWLSCNRKIGRKYLQTKVPLLVYCAVHFVSIYLYQMDFVQDYIPPESLSARLLGLPDLVLHNCSSPDPRSLIFQGHSWAIYASPFFVLGLYCLLALILRKQLFAPSVEECKYDPPMSRADSKQSSQFSQSSVRRRKSSRRATRNQEERARVGRTSSVRKLLDDDHTGRSYRTIDSGDAAAKETLAVDPNGSIIWTSESDMPEIVVEPLEEGEKPPPSKSFGSKVKKVFNPILSALKLIAKGSYIATLIVMMTWSITYHSWLTFVLLLWSCIIWMSPNSRYVCLRSSPALVFYAEALLLLQYIYGLDLTEEELPSKNVGQIGLVKYGDLTYQPLTIKVLYTVMFWITMRQFFEERQQTSERNIAEGLTLEPFNISYNTATPACPRPSIKRHFSIVPSVTSPNPYIRVVAETISNLLTKYWIWIVATMLMVISLGGQVVVVYRIVYMFLFLFFILMFQFSYQLWRRIMYGFWLTVIVFSMLVLIIIYTYQFKDFDIYWEKYLHVSKSVQKDLGLEIYESDTGTLFVKLLTPTFFLIITIIQLHYFHKDFLLISDIHYRSSENIADTTQLTTASNLANDSTETHITIEHEPEVERPKSLDLKTPTHPRGPASEVGSPSTPKRDDGESNRAEREFRAVKVCLENIFKEVSEVFTYVSEVLWRVLEIHIIKVVLLSTFCLAAYDVCAIHVAFVCFVVVCLPLPALQKFFSHCISVWAAALLLSKMIYQLNSVDYLNWQTNCSSVAFVNSSEFPYPFNTTIDNHDWIGFKRTHYLADYCKGYIALILVLTIQAVVKIRQEVNRIHFNLPEPKTGVIFPDTTRCTADDSLLECLKYLANYFFYKFGLECCFMTIVVCVGVRLDVFGFLSAVWLSSMFLLKRKTLARIWPVYVAYQCIVLTLQYLMCLGIPPGFCIEYPWTEPLEKGLREWLFLPNFQTSLNTSKIVADFFQLLFACCQLFVFRIETSPVAGLYEGGSNKEIDFAHPEPNPIPDFVTCTKSILDMLKVLVFYAFYWISLAVAFQAGTARINLFAMGYVVSCFYFLWNGNEFYLKSRPALLRMWNILLAYNVTVILISCLLQLVGCTYFELLCRKQCWLVQLLGIACQQRAKNAPTKVEDCRFEPDPGLVYDIICFAFLLLQRRLFSSYYFQHVVNEVKAQQVLSSRGAELIHEIQMKEVMEQQANEREIMERIKKKMDRIRAYQQKIRGGENMEPETHFQAIRSGDYYMFEDFSDDDIDLELSARHKRSVDDEDEDSAEVKEKGLNALLSKTIRGSLKLVEEPRKESGEVDDVEDSSQQSAIVSADRDATATATSQKKSPDPLTITSSGPTMSLSMPSSASSTSASSPKEDTVAALSPQDVKLIEEEKEKEETFVEKVKRWYGFFCTFVNSVLISTTAKLNAVSKDYRFVARQLSKEKKLLKERFINNGSFDMKKAEDEMKCKEELNNIPGSSKDLKQVAVVVKKTNLDFLGSCELTSSQDVLDGGSKKHPTFMRFLVALYYAAISRSELLCYIVIVVNQMKAASILSLPLPLLVFLWGTLSVPRPTKAFWITIITYTEAIVVLKYLFQFYFFSWNNTPPPPNNPFYPTIIFGVRKDENYAGYDLAVLLVVFFHRFMLKSLGLWKDTEKSLIIPNVEVTSERGSIASHGQDKDRERTVSVPVPVPEVKALPEPKKATPEDGVGGEESDGLDECSDGEGSEMSLYEELPKVDVTKIVGNVVDPVKMFFYHLLYPEYRVTVDVYAYMFFCDFINFFIVVFGYSAFGTEDAEAVTSYFKENKVPIPFLIMLIAQFAIIVTDRALYLRKYILGKLIFQIITVFVVHMWIFFILPAITARDFVTSPHLPPKMWYFIKCLYLLLSAYQIRSGYPTRILGNFFCKKYNYANLFLFKGYMIIPFLYELRSLMDWIWTDTSMNVSNWLKMEDIYANVFVLKCTRRAEADYPTPRGAKRTALIKYGVGGFLLFFIILIIWFPLLLFALGNTVGRSNTPVSCTVELAITGYEPIFRTTALQHQIHKFTADQWRDLEKAVAQLAEPSTTSFLTSYDKDDTVLVELSNNSTSIWTISPPSQTALIRELRGDNELKMVLSWSFLRKSEDRETNPEIGASRELTLDDKKLRQRLADALSVNYGNASTITGSVPESTTIKDVFPNYVKIPGTGSASVVTTFYPGKTENPPELFGKNPYRDLKISMWTGDMLNTSELINASSGSHYVEWWEIQDDCSTRKPYALSGVNDCNFLRLVAFSDKAFPSELSLISGYGIVGLYTTFVLVVSRVVRGFVAGTSFTIMFDDMPYVDRVLQLCLDIYLVRESGEFTLEEDLFAKLIFLYRSPEMLIKWTRPPEPEAEEAEANLRLQ